jgi:16S rRNA (cytosine1407-C5)-methyltransferase
VATNYDGRFFKNTPEIFDKILLDAPCSGEWTAFKTEEALKYWNLKNIKVVSKLQYGLLESAIKSLKVDWELVYSTCTLNKFENEWVIEKALKKYGDCIEIVPLSEENDFKRNWPHLEFTGWFFIAKIKKTKSLIEKNEVDSKWDNKEEKIKYVRQNIEKISNTDEKKILEFFMENFNFDLSSYYLYNYMWEIHLINQNLNDIWEKIFLYKIWIKIWDLKDWNFIPNFYSWTFNKFEKNILEVNKDELDKLLKWFELSKDLKNSYYQIIYDDLELGLAKFKNWKIKSLIPTKLMRN